ncbi:hypothetical protein F5Y07DRAFT_245143 [Xylaria sp. FL0933]|nr:hypothetical protein F5Y07DRAFT_245143 [Xylaria sp. FL0933]
MPCIASGERLDRCGPCELRERMHSLYFIYFRVVKDDLASIIPTLNTMEHLLANPRREGTHVYEYMMLLVCMYGHYNSLLLQPPTQITGTIAVKRCLSRPWFQLNKILRYLATAPPVDKPSNRKMWKMAKGWLDKTLREGAEQDWRKQVGNRKEKTKMSESPYDIITPNLIFHGSR